jgi:hypothetical protein
MKKNQQKPLLNHNEQAVIILIFVFIVTAILENW